MKKTFPHTLGLALGGLFGLFHASWALLVALGVAQPLIDWILRMHMIEPFYRILPFNLITAILLVVMTSLVGYVVGWVGGTLWVVVEKQ